MQQAKIVLLSILVVQLLYVSISFWRFPEQMEEVVGNAKTIEDELQDLKRNTADLERELDRRRRHEDELIRELIAAKSAVTAWSAGYRAASNGDGNPPPLVWNEGSGTSTSGDGSATAERSGIPVAGESFLRPPIDEYFRPEWEGGTMREYVGLDEPSTNPITTNFATISRLHGMINDSLCGTDPRDPERWHQSLATECIISDDFKTFTFTIRPDVYWQKPRTANVDGLDWIDEVYGDGYALTAEDFAFYLDMVKHPEVKASHLQNYFEKVERWEAVDEHTFRIYWSEPLYTNIGSSLGLQPLPKKLYSRDREGRILPEQEVGIQFNDHWLDKEHLNVGTGSYELAQYTIGDMARFEKNPDYWGAPPHIDTVEWIGRIVDHEAQYTNFKNGQVQHFGLLPSHYQHDILGRGDQRFGPASDAQPDGSDDGTFGWRVVKDRAYTYIAWNMRHPIFSDRRVRHAMTHAFPMDDILRDVYHGLGTPQLGPVSPDNPYYNTDLKPLGFDLDKAARLLAEAGWTDSDRDGWLDKEIDGRRIPLRFQMTYPSGYQTWDSVMNIYRDALREINIDMELAPVRYQDLFERLRNRDFAASIGAWQIGVVTADFKQIWHSDGANDPESSNYVGFADERVDELSLKLRRTFDRDERVAIAREIQAIIHEEQPYTFFRAVQQCFAWQNKSDDRDRVLLGGVEEDFAIIHPLLNTEARMNWHIEEP